MSSLAVVRDIHAPTSLGSVEAAGAYQEDLLAEFVLARSARGVADATVRAELSAVSEFLDWAGCFAWEVGPGHGDRFLVEAQRDKAVKTRQVKAARIATFYRFLELCYQGEIRRLTGWVVASPIDEVNRPINTGAHHGAGTPSAGGAGRVLRSLARRAGQGPKWRIASRNYAALEEAARTLELTEVLTVEHWRTRAWITRDPAEHRRVVRRAVELLTGQAPPMDEPVAVTEARL